MNSIPSTPYFRDRRLHVYSGLHHATSRKKQKNRAIFQKENANFCRIRLHHEKNQKGAILIPKEECKLLPQNPKKHFFGIFLEFIKIGIPKKLSTLRQNFFANFFCIFFFGIHQDLVRICFFLEILQDEATFFNNIVFYYFTSLYSHVHELEKHGCAMLINYEYNIL